MHYAQTYACKCYVLILWFPSLHAGLYLFLPPDSREFEDLVKIVSSCYLDSSSRGTFSYCKARLIQNELLEKEVGHCLHSCTFYPSHICKHLWWFLCLIWCVPILPVHREAERDEAGGTDWTRTNWIVLLPLSRQIKGINDEQVMKH